MLEMATAIRNALSERLAEVPSVSGSKHLLDLPPSGARGGQQVTSVPISHFHAIAMPGVLWCPNPSCSVVSELDLRAHARSRNAPETAGFVYVLAGLALAPPTGVEPVTFGLGIQARTAQTSAIIVNYARAIGRRRWQQITENP